MADEEKENEAAPEEKKKKSPIILVVILVLALVVVALLVVWLVFDHQQMDYNYLHFLNYFPYLIGLFLNHIYLVNCLNVRQMFELLLFTFQLLFMNLEYNI